MKTSNNVIKSNLYLDYLNNLVLSDKFGWKYISTTADVRDKLDSNLNGTFYHNLYHHLNNIKSEHYDVFLPLVFELLEASGLNNYKVIRSRLGLLQNRGKSIVHAPHVDYIEPHKTIIYYLNQSDGSTFFYNEDMVVENNLPKMHDTFTVSHQNIYKKNSMVVFDGHTYHSSSTPIQHENRIVLNINLISI